MKIKSILSFGKTKKSNPPKIKSIINFKCLKCKETFDCDVGRIAFLLPAPNARPKFERDIQCGNCGLLTIDDVELTEWGQTQLTELFLKSERIRL